MKETKIIFAIAILGAFFAFLCPSQTKKPTEKEFMNLIRTEGVAKAVEVFRLLRKQHPDISIFERRTLNNLGWELASAGELEKAIEVFKLNIEAYPDHFDPYDSYAEALVIRGDYPLAVEKYKKSLELNPDNLNAARSITVLENYSKHEYMIPMRDGVKLYTQVYLPKDTRRTYPMLLLRDMYSVGNYDKTVRKKLGPSDLFAKEGFIFVYQDIRGRYKSEGEFLVLRPYLPHKRNSQDIDEASDTYDTIEWLLRNIPHHNGRVGLWGGSYSGWLTVMGMIDAHPALKAFSPGASPSDWWLGDDCHHNGAFRLMYAFDWINNDARPRKSGPITSSPPLFDYGTPDGYKFFMDIGPLSNINEKYLHNSNPTWNEYMEHGDYDEYWRKRDILQHLGHITQPVLNIAAWFDAEDFRGPLSIYDTIEKKNPDNKNRLVVGPWRHGGWHSAGDKLGNISFGQETGSFFMEKVEFPFFKHYLKEDGDLSLPEATVFETGKNQWASYDRWPPEEAVEKHLYLQADGKLSFMNSGNRTNQPYSEFISDPGKPVPWSAAIQPRQGHLWMVEDQRFAARRPDVLVYQTDILTEDMTIAGPIMACLHVSTTGTDADWVVKLIDVYPSHAPDGMGDYQMLIAGDVLRSKYRTSFEKPEPMVPHRVTPMTFNLWDKYHCFLKGHRIMVQVQSTWFPVIDRNPQKFVDIYHAKEADFQKAVHRVYHSKEYTSSLKILWMK